MGEGDVFLFFGWFRRVESTSGLYRYGEDTPDLHVIFGLLQVGQAIPAVDIGDAPEWALYHPHLDRPRLYGDNNCVYAAADRVRIPGFDLDIPGGGAFERFHPDLCLTAPGRSRSVWRLPSWFYPEGRESSLSYHRDMGRWSPVGDHVILRSVGRGQEFVLDCDHYPEAIPWLAGMLKAKGI